MTTRFEDIRGSFTGPQNWGGGGLGVTRFTILCGSMMQDQGTCTCTYEPMPCYVEDVLCHGGGGLGCGWVGWGRVKTFINLRASMI